MDLHALGAWLMSFPISDFIRESDWAFPAIESAHVVAVLLVVGTVSIVDLRLVGFASRNSAVTEISRDTLRWTWVAFVFAAITGSLMLMAKANDYFAVPSFWVKMFVMFLAAVNMLTFEVLTFRNVAQWDIGSSLPTAAKVAGTVSLALWVLVIIFGRWIGYTVDHGVVFGHGF